MRSKNAFFNLTTSITLQIVAAISGLIIPRLMIITYGSEVNGVIISISQFLSYIAISEAGLGAVIATAFYKPLADKNSEKLNSVIVASDSFLKKIGISFLIYMVILAFVYPFIVISEFDFMFVFWMIFILGISIFTQFYFATSFTLLLSADQKAYINAWIQIVTIILNIVVVVLLVHLEMNVHVVRLGSALVFLLRPAILRFYVLKHYEINSKAKPDFEAISQRWAALNQHVAYVVQKNAAVIILTIFCNVKDVSVFSVYNMITTAIVGLIQMVSSSVRASFGNMIANGEKETLERNFNLLLFLNDSATTILFTTAAIMVMPFIDIYTRGVTDANYLRIEFAVIFFWAEAIFCLRIPYHTLAIASGHFRQIQNATIIEALINVAISLIMVRLYGLTGAAVGVLCAVTFRCIHYIAYMKLVKPVNYSIKRVLLRIFLCVLSSIMTMIVICYFIDTSTPTYFSWFYKASIVFIISSLITITINSIAYKHEINNLSTITCKLFGNFIKKK